MSLGCNHLRAPSALSHDATHVQSLAPCQYHCSPHLHRTMSSPARWQHPWPTRTHTRVGGSLAPARIAAAQLARVVAPSNAVRSILGCTAQEHFSRQCRTSARRTRRSNKRASRATLLAGVLRHLQPEQPPPLQPTTRERVTQPCPHSKALHVSTRPFRTQILAKPLSLCPRTPSILDRLLKSKARSSAATSLRRPRSCSAALWPDGVCVRRRRRAHIFVSQCERSEQEAPG